MTRPYPLGTVLLNKSVLNIVLLDTEEGIWTLGVCSSFPRSYMHSTYFWRTPDGTTTIQWLRPCEWNSEKGQYEPV